MGANQILFHKQTRKKVDEGVEILDRVVGSTLGARGFEVGFFAPGDMAMAMHDGVEVARRVIVEDLAHYWAIRTILQAANSQVLSVGDGTTASIILACEIYRQAILNITAGTNPRALIADLIKNRDVLLAEIKKQAIEVKDMKQAVSIAKISAQDEDLGQKIGEIVYKMGVDGVVTTEANPEGVIEVDFQEGCQFENGWISPAFITDPMRGEATVENTKILLTDKPLYNINELVPLLNQFSQNNIPNLVVIAQDVRDSALSSMILTKLRMNREGNGMNLLAVRAPYSGQVQKDFLDDIAILTGGVVISSEQGRNFTDVSINELGEAKRVTSTDKATMIVGGKGDKTAINKRVAMLKDMKARALGKSDYEKEKIKERLGKISSGIAVIKIGAPTEIEQNNFIERAKDAIQATTSALKDGFVPGGEVLYLSIREALDQTLGGRILYNALERPFHLLLSNAGLKPDLFIEKIEKGLGVDVTDGEVKDMVSSGIIDPAAVSTESLKNAISSAITLFSTQTLILPIKEKK